MLRTIAYRSWSKTVPVFYVESVPGDGGKDWGYTDQADKAIHLSPYWQRRFASDCRAVGSTYNFLEVSHAIP